MVPVSSHTRARKDRDLGVIVENMDDYLDVELHVCISILKSKKTARKRAEKSILCSDNSSFLK